MKRKPAKCERLYHLSLFFVVEGQNGWGEESGNIYTTWHTSLLHTYYNSIHNGAHMARGQRDFLSKHDYCTSEISINGSLHYIEDSIKSARLFGIELLMARGNEKGISGLFVRPALGYLPVAVQKPERRRRMPERKPPAARIAT